MLNLILAPLGILMMVLGAVGLFVAVRGMPRSWLRRVERLRRPEDDA